MASSSPMTTASNKSMAVERPAIISQEPLKCPRCDSSNTKFCYYNNYSLSQPRHFCKACKRYWTRGGTLRNVPVGGGCRKNNRVKRPTSSNAAVGVLSAAGSAANPSSFLQHRLDLPHSSPSSFLYNLSSADTMNPLDFSFPFSCLSTATKVSSSDDLSSALFDIHPRVIDLGIGFSSSSSSGLVEDGGLRNNIEFRNSFSSSLSSSSVFSPSTTTMASSLLASTIEQQKYISNHGGLKDDTERSSNNLQDLMTMPYHEDKITQQNGSSGCNPSLNPNPYYHHISQMDNLSNPNSSLLRYTSNVSTSARFDPSNSMAGSSVPSLI